MFADRGSCVRWCSLPFAAVRLCSKYCVMAVPLGGAHKMRQKHLWDVDFLANSIVLCRFVTCVAMMIACCVAGAILWKPVNVTVSFSSGRRSALCLCVLQFRGRRSIN